MRVWERRHPYAEGTLRTVVKEDGTYEQWEEYKGDISLIYASTVFDMGWSSVREFIRTRPNFESVTS